MVEHVQFLYYIIVCKVKYITAHILKIADLLQESIIYKMSGYSDYLSTVTDKFRTAIDEHYILVSKVIKKVNLKVIHFLRLI